MARDGDTTAVGIAAGTAGKLAANVNIGTGCGVSSAAASFSRGRRSDSLAKANFFSRGDAQSIPSMLWIRIPDSSRTSRHVTRLIYFLPDRGVDAHLAIGVKGKPPS
jgi:hypothetical protein